MDVRLDARSPLPFRSGVFELVFAEHFLEHLERSEGSQFLEECRRVLAPGGRIRLSTPNLDWVWRTHYRHPADDETKRLGAFHLNQAFHGWGHRFLYNDVVLADALAEAGFRSVTFHRWGESEVPSLRGIERHEVNDFEVTPECPDVLVAEAIRPS